MARFDFESSCVDHSVIFALIQGVDVSRRSSLSGCQYSCLCSLISPIYELSLNVLLGAQSRRGARRVRSQSRDMPDEILNSCNPADGIACIPFFGGGHLKRNSGETSLTSMTFVDDKKCSPVFRAAFICVSQNAGFAITLLVRNLTQKGTLKMCASQTGNTSQPPKKKPKTEEQYLTPRSGLKNN